MLGVNQGQTSMSYHSTWGEGEKKLSLKQYQWIFFPLVAQWSLLCVVLCWILVVCPIVYTQNFVTILLCWQLTDTVLFYSASKWNFDRTTTNLVCFSQCRHIGYHDVSWLCKTPKNQSNCHKEFSTLLFTPCNDAVIIAMWCCLWWIIDLYWY